MFLRQFWGKRIFSVSLSVNAHFLLDISPLPIKALLMLTLYSLWAVNHQYLTKGNHKSNKFIGQISIHSWYLPSQINSADFNKFDWMSCHIASYTVLKRLYRRLCKVLLPKGKSMNRRLLWFLMAFEGSQLCRFTWLAGICLNIESFITSIAEQTSRQNIIPGWGLLDIFWPENIRCYGALDFHEIYAQKAAHFQKVELEFMWLFTHR